MEKELYFLALTDTNGWHWVLFLSQPKFATPEQTGFVAIGNNYEDKEDAEQEMKMLNYSMFRIE